MDWSRSFTSSYYATFVDPKTWADVSSFDITGGSIQYSGDTLKGSATIECKEYPYTSEQWVRVWMNADQEGDCERVPLFTGLAIYPSKKMHGLSESNTLNCYSVLKPAEDILLQNGWYIQKGADVKEVLKKLLSVTNAPVTFEDYQIPILMDNIIAEQGETYLSMAQLLIDVINWRIVINGYGEIIIGPKPSETGIISSTFHSIDYDILEVDWSYENDWYNSPNVLRVTSGELTAIARDDDESSPYSTVARGREIWAEENGVVLNSNQSLSQYAVDRLKDLQYTTYKVSYTRRYDPDVRVSDYISIFYPEVKLYGTFEVASQTINIGSGARTSEEVYMK